MSDGLVFLLAFLGIGVVMLLIGGVCLITYNKKRKRCSETVVATIVNSASQEGYSMSEGRRTVNYRYGMYEYQLNGVIYHSCSMVGTTANPKIGKNRVLFVNPDNPEEIIEKRFASIMAIVIFGALGIFFCLLGIILGLCVK